MKRYCGSYTIAYAAIILPLFIIFSLVFGIVALYSSTTDEAAILVSLLCFACAVMMVVILRKVWPQFYTWAHFGNDCVTIKTLFSKSIVIKYADIRSAGIAFYCHGIWGSGAGPKVYFIFLSLDPFEEKYRSKITEWLPSHRRIKFGYSKKLSLFLLDVLPTRSASSLRRDLSLYKKL